VADVTEQVTTLVLVRVGCCGPVSFEDGVLVNLPAEVADELVRSGDAARVTQADRPAPDPTPDTERTPRW
jgi:hypothetical protein